MVFLIIRLTGFEPVTVGTEIQYSIQLSYKRKKMIQQQTILKVSDNSGAKTAKCIKILGGFKKRFGYVGDIVIVSIQQLRNKSKKTAKVKKGGIYKALLIRTKKKIKNREGSFTIFNNNAVSLINKHNSPIATRILGPVSKKLKTNNIKLATISASFV